MKRLTAVLIVCCLLSFSFSGALAETGGVASREDHVSVTGHTATIQGKEIAYTVTAGTMAMSTELGNYDLSFTYYPSGHMFYQHEPSLQQFRKDAESWYQ